MPSRFRGGIDGVCSYGRSETVDSPLSGSRTRAPARKARPNRQSHAIEKQGLFFNAWGCFASALYADPEEGCPEALDQRLDPEPRPVAHADAPARTGRAAPRIS